MTEQDGSFRRLIETVKNRQSGLSGLPGRPPKNRVSTTGRFTLQVHNRIRMLAKERSEHSDRLVSASDLYNEAAIQFMSDLHQLLGDEMKIPAGTVSLSGILGLRELIDRPILTPLHKLPLQTKGHQRTTLYLDETVWDALMEVSLRFALQMRRPLHIHRLMELSAAWYLTDFKDFDS